MSHYSTAAASQMDGGTGDGSPGRPSMSILGHSARPSLAGRPISIASFGGNNFAGVGSTRHTPAASFSAAAHSRNISQAQSAAGRPTSSFYALDGHSFIETPPTSAELPGQQRTRAAGVGHGDRVSRVSFAESAYTGGHSKRPSSFFAASSPNAHKSKHSVASIPAMPRVPANAATGYEASDFSAGSDDASPHVLSPEEIAHMGSRKGSKSSSPVKNGKKHNITVSTSMPFLGNIGGRQSIMSPDDLMKAYAFKAHQPAERPDTTYTDTSKYVDEQDEVVRSSEEGEAPKKGKFGKFGFGAAK